MSVQFGLCIETTTDRTQRDLEASHHNQSVPAGTGATRVRPSLKQPPLSKIWLKTVVSFSFVRLRRVLLRLRGGRRTHPGSDRQGVHAARLLSLFAALRRSQDARGDRTVAALLQVHVLVRVGLVLQQHGRRLQRRRTNVQRVHDRTTGNSGNDLLNGRRDAWGGHLTRCLHLGFCDSQLLWGPK